MITAVNLNPCIDKTVWIDEFKCGSVPYGIPISVYKELLDAINEIPVKTILDAEGDLLLEGLKGNPNIIKPNLFELETALNKKLNSHWCKKELNYVIRRILIKF